jgi:hypothetical protein
VRTCRVAGSQQRSGAAAGGVEGGTHTLQQGGGAEGGSVRAPRRAAPWPFAAGGADADAHAAAALLPQQPRYDAVRIFVLTAAWSAPRAANAARICAAARAAHAANTAAHANATASAAHRLRAVSCRVVPALRGGELTPSDAARAQAAGLVSLAPLPPPPRLLRTLLLPLLPRALAPLLPEHPQNQLTPPNWRWRGALANTLGALSCLQEMAASAAEDDASFLQNATSDAALPSARTLYVYLEDDAELGAFPERFAAALVAASEALPSTWDVLQLSPPRGLCDRAARLPPPWRVRPGGLLTPSLSLSRTTGVAFSAEGVASLLSRLPATNTIDLWLRALLRARALTVRVSCGGLVDFHATSATQA